MKHIMELLAEIKASSDLTQIRELTRQIEGLVSGNYLANHADLYQVLQALLAPDHHIRELQYTRSLPDNPINKLVAQFNAQNG